jgi:hypothetical protein
VDRWRQRSWRGQPSMFDFNFNSLLIITRQHDANDNPSTIRGSDLAAIKLKETNASMKRYVVVV